MNLNDNFPISKGYPCCKVIEVPHWHEHYYEFEWSGDAIAESFDLFFDNILSYLREKESENFKKRIYKNFTNPFQIRFLVKHYSKSFLESFNYFIKKY